MIKNIYIFFTHQNKEVYKKIIFISLVLLFAMIIEMVGLSLIIPLVTQIISEQPNFLLVKIDDMSVHFINFNFLDFINNINFFENDQSRYVIITTIFVLIFYTIKVVLLTFSLKIQSNFIYLIHANLSGLLFKKYLNNSYKFHLNNNSSKLLKNLISEIDELIINGIVPLILLITDASLIFAIFLLLLFFEPIGTISAVLFIVLMCFIFIKLTNKKIIHVSTKRQIYEDIKYKEFQEALGSILEIKVYQKEKYFYNKFYNNLIELRKIASYHHFITFIPQVWLEYVSLYGLFFVIFIMTASSSESSVQIATLSLFAASLFRLLPAMSRVISSYNRLKFTKVVFSLINKHLSEEISDIDKTSLSFNQNTKKETSNTIIFDNVSFKYDKSDKNILENVSFEINKNKINGIIGRSGSGKSTLVNLLLGVIEPDSGSIYLNQKNNNSLSSNWVSNFSYVPQKIYLTDESILQNVVFGEDITKKNDTKINDIIKKVQLNDFITSLPNGMSSSIGERGVRISGGQNQRLGIARALYQDREIIILDEATSALDKKTEDELLSEIFSNLQNKTYIIIAHRKETIDKCDNLFLIENKKVKKIK